MNDAALIRRLSAKASCSQFAARRVLRALPDAMVDALNAGEEIRLLGIGSFRCVMWRPRTARDFQSGARIVLAERSRIEFSPAERFSFEVKRGSGA